MMAGEKSKSIPFLPAPSNLEGMIGNKGFDPIGFSDFLDIRWLREAGERGEESVLFKCSSHNRHQDMFHSCYSYGYPD